MVFDEHEQDVKSVVLLYLYVSTDVPSLRRSAEDDLLIPDPCGILVSSKPGPGKLVGADGSCRHAQPLLLCLHLLGMARPVSLL